MIAIVAQPIDRECLSLACSGYITASCLTLKRHQIDSPKAALCERQQLAGSVSAPDRKVGVQSHFLVTGSFPARS